MEQLLNDLPHHILSGFKLFGIFLFGCLVMAAIIYITNYLTQPKPKRLEKLHELKERTYYPIDTIGKYHGTKVIISPAILDKDGEPSCDECMAYNDTTLCRAHSFMCDTLVREDGENIILKEIK